MALEGAGAARSQLIAGVTTIAAANRPGQASAQAPAWDFSTTKASAAAGVFITSCSAMPHEAVRAPSNDLRYSQPMHPNAQLITDFYEGFNRLNPEPMVKVYAPDAEFSDPAFPHLRGAEIGAMWTMLCSRAKGFSLTFRDVRADDSKGSAHWEADYLFQGGRKVHNVIDATFTFRDGKVIKHADAFDFWRWSRMALGLPGVVLGWSGLLQKKVQAKAARGLQEFRAKQGAETSS